MDSNDGISAEKMFGTEQSCPHMGKVMSVFFPTQDVGLETLTLGTFPSFSRNECSHSSENP